MDENKVHHRAIVRISYEFLRRILFPEGTEILSITTDPNDIYGHQEFVCVIENPDLPVSSPGVALPVCTPTYHRLYSGKETEMDVIEFVDWGM